jgi:uncharacterized repeat protein (TIGR03943 family)
MTRTMTRTWSPQRLATGGVLAVWAGLFWFLLLSGRTSLYLSSRTSWVVPVGAVLLSTAALGRVASARTDRVAPIRPREAWVLGAVALPAVLVLALPPATLTSFAASRRSAFVGAGISSSAEDISSGELTLLDVAGAQTTKEGQHALARRAGEPVSFVGFVARTSGTPADELLLTRFIISCCVADATIAQVRVVNAPPGEFEDDEWVQVDGTIYPLGREILVDAASIRRVDRPETPYLTP